MYKEESYYDDNGQKVFNRTTKFTGRFHEDRGYLLYVHGATISSRIIEFPIELSQADIGKLAVLSRHLQPDTNILAYRSNRGKAPMDMERIGAVIGTEYRNTLRFLKRMTDLSMIKKQVKNLEEGQEVRFIVNPLYFHNGKSINDKLYWLYEKELNVHLPAWAIEKYRKRKAGEA